MKFNYSLNFIFLLFFIVGVIKCQSNARIQDVSTFSKNLYADPNCNLIIDIFIDNIEIGYQFSSLSGSINTSTAIPPSMLNSSDNTFTYRFNFQSQVIETNNGLGLLNLTLILSNKLDSSQLLINSKSIQFYCEKPPQAINIYASRFTLSASRYYLVATFRVGEWVKNNLPNVTPAQAQQSLNGILINVVKPNYSQNFYTISILTTSNLFDMFKSYFFVIRSISWPAIQFTLEIQGPLYSSTPVSGSMIPFFYPPITDCYSMHYDNTLYTMLNITSPFPPVEYLSTHPIDSWVNTMYSTILSGSYDTVNNKSNNLWLNPFLGYNNNQLSYAIYISWTSSGITIPTNYTLASNYITKSGYFEIVNQAVAPRSSKILFVIFSTNVINSDSMTMPITNKIIGSSNEIKYSYSTSITFPYSVSYPASKVIYSTVLISSETNIFTSDIYSAALSFFTNPTSTDNLAPTINNIKITSLNGGFFLIEANVTDSGGSGFLEISAFSGSYITTTLLSYSDYKSGDIYNGATYQRIFKVPVDSFYDHKLYVYDQAGNSQMYIEENVLKPILVLPASPYNTNIPTWVISYFAFEKSSMDLEKNGTWNTAYLNYTNLDLDSNTLFTNYPYFMLTPYKLNQNIHFYKPIAFYYDSKIKMFACNFFIPSGIPYGQIDYKITNPLFDTEYYSNYIQSQFNYNEAVQLKSISKNYKSTPPTVGGISSPPPPTITGFDDTSNNGSFTITFDDNDLEIGYITVSTTSVPKIRKRYFNFTITPDQALPLGSNTYKIEFPLTCFTTVYEIIYSKFINKQGYISEFSKFDSIYSQDLYRKDSVPYNPFMNFYSQSLPSISTTCTVSPNDLTTNTISIISFDHSLQLFNTIDVGLPSLINRTFNVEFTVKDLVYGIDTSQKPIVYLIGGLLGKNKLSFQVTDVTVFNATTCIFKTSITVPYGFAYPYPIYFEIYGVVNRVAFIKGWSNSDLVTIFGSSSTNIPTLKTTIAPFIISHIPLYVSNSQLIINGFNLNPNSIVLKKLNAADSIELYIISANGNLMVLDLGTDNNVPSFIISVKSNDNGQISNEYLIDVLNSQIRIETPTPTQTSTSTPAITNAPQKCIGTPECGGPLKGYCSSSGCHCYSPNIGIDCSSKVVIIPPPSIDPSSPSINLTTPEEKNSETASLVGIVSIVSIRELDLNLNLIKTYKFSTWISTKSSVNEFENFYTTNFTTTNQDGKESICKISVSTNWYQSLTNITFADQQLVMNPSTLKYNINITDYTFESNLNTLELVVSATAKTDNIDDSTCSNQEFGETSNGDNSNYVQLKINNLSLYGRFVKRGIIDQTKIVGISNVILNDLSKTAIDTYYTSQSYIGLRIPFFVSDIQLDPDFSVLISSNNNDKSSNSICKSNNSSGLSKGALIGVIVGCVGGAIIITIAILIYIKYKYQLKHNLKKINILKMEAFKSK